MIIPSIPIQIYHIKIIPPMKIKKYKAINLVVLAVAILTIGYLILAGTLLGRNLKRLNTKMDIIEQKNAWYFTAEYFTGGIPYDQIWSICFQKNCFTTEFAMTLDDQMYGLMFREKMNNGSGMLFVYNEVWIRKFRMKNTLIPLDIIRFDEEFEVMHISHDTPPCPAETTKCPSYGPDLPAYHILEINGGLAQLLQINTWNQATFQLR